MKGKSKGAVPDWNKIHSKQLFQRQPDLSQWHKERQARTERLFGGKAVASTSTSNNVFKSRVVRRALHAADCAVCDERQRGGGDSGEYEWVPGGGPIR